MTLKSILIGYLPTGWSKAIAGTTIVLVGIELWLPQSLPPSLASIWNKQTITKEPAFLTILILSTLLLGTLLTLLLTVVAYHKKIKEITTTKNNKTKEKVMATVEKAADKFLEQQFKHKPLDEMEIRILLFLWKQAERITAEEIAETLSVEFQLVQSHLAELEKKRMVHGALYVGSPRDWKLIQDGRKYLIENKLISQQAAQPDGA